MPETHVAGFVISFTFRVHLAVDCTIAPRYHKGMGYVPLPRNGGGLGWLGLGGGLSGARKKLTFILRSSRVQGTRIYHPPQGSARRPVDGWWWGMRHRAAY